MKTSKTLLALTIPLLLTACGSPSTETTETDVSPLVVNTQLAQLQQVNFQAQFIGKTEAVDTVDIRPKISGYITQRVFEEGTQVLEGDLLYTIDAAPFEAEVTRLNALKEQKTTQYKLQEKKLAKANALNKQQALSSFEVDEIEASRDALNAEVKAAEAALDSAKLQLSYTNIYAPFDGLIGASKVSVGDLVGPESNGLTNLVSNSSMYVNVQLNEKQYLNDLQDKLQKSEKINVPDIKLTLANGTIYNQPGEVNFIDNQVDPQTGNITFRFKFDNPNSLLLPGQYVTLKITSFELEQALTVPQNIVQEDQGGRYVLVVDSEEKAQAQYVQLGQRVDQNWVVQSGLEEGQRLITSGLQQARPGNPVTAN